MLKKFEATHFFIMNCLKALQEFLVPAITEGWIEIVELLILKGVDVAAFEYDAVSLGNCRMKEKQSSFSNIRI
jgi:hypothetical protein